MAECEESQPRMDNMDDNLSGDEESQREDKTPDEKGPCFKEYVDDDTPEKKEALQVPTPEAKAKAKAKRKSNPKPQRIQAKIASLTAEQNKNHKELKSIRTEKRRLNKQGAQLAKKAAKLKAEDLQDIAQMKGLEIDISTKDPLSRSTSELSTSSRSTSANA